MNRQEITIVGLLILLLLGWLYYQNQQQREALLAARQQAAQAATNETVNALSPLAQASAHLTDAASTADSSPAPLERLATTSEPAASLPEQPELPETTLVLSNAQLRLTLSSKGGTLRTATLPAYRATVERDSEPVRLDFAPAPALALHDLPGLGLRSDFELTPQGATAATLHCTSVDGLHLERHIELHDDYRVTVRDQLHNLSSEGLLLPASGMSLGAVHRGLSRNDTLGIDSYTTLPDHRGRSAKVRRWDTRLNGLFTGGSGGRGCGGPPAADGLPLTASSEVEGYQSWIALKSRFFVQAFVSHTTNTGYRIEVAREAASGPLRLRHASAEVRFPGVILAPDANLVREHTLYIGSKRLALLKNLAPRSAEIMQFGAFKWMCVILLPLLNLFYALIPNYGIAIILLTVLVRMIFWPLTHKSSESMKRMQTLQPQLKEIQAKFKDDPQKLQQETWQLYRENKVNPMSSCLPMLIQIPVFIALFTVLRSAVELRFAPFLWIADLSEPENLLAGLIPNGPSLNILPILMAATMLLQSKLTPAMGDPAQQKMMMWMMPAMMLFMFYSMPSALVLYWTVSQALAIAQLLWQKRRTAAAQQPSSGLEEPGKLSRQERRRLERQSPSQP